MAKGATKATGKRGKKDSDEAYTVAKPKGAKAEKDPNQPKKPMSAYFHFLQERRQTLKQEKPDLRMGESTKLMTGEWNKMTDKVKQKYQDLADADKKRYYSECEEKGIKVKSNPANKAKDAGGPKKPQSAYFLFQAEERERLKKDKPDAKQSEIMKLVGA